MQQGSRYQGGRLRPLQIDQSLRACLPGQHPVPAAALFEQVALLLFVKLLTGDDDRFDVTVQGAELGLHGEAPNLPDATNRLERGAAA